MRSRWCRGRTSWFPWASLQRPGWRQQPEPAQYQNDQLILHGTQDGNNVVGVERQRQKHFFFSSSFGCLYNSGYCTDPFRGHYNEVNRLAKTKFRKLSNKQRELKSLEKGGKWCTIGNVSVCRVSTIPKSRTTLGCPALPYGSSVFMGISIFSTNQSSSTPVVMDPPYFWAV